MGGGGGLLRTLGWKISEVKRTRGGFSGYCSLKVTRSWKMPPCGRWREEEGGGVEGERSLEVGLPSGRIPGRCAAPVGRPPRPAPCQAWLNWICPQRQAGGPPPRASRRGPSQRPARQTGFRPTAATPSSPLAAPPGGASTAGRMQEFKKIRKASRELGTACRQGACTEMMAGEAGSGASKRRETQRAEGLGRHPCPSRRRQHCEAPPHTLMACSTRTTGQDLVEHTE